VNPQSVPAIARLYKDRGDPWAFETSPYEAAKYRETLAALAVLAAPRFANALEVRCANGVLTGQLRPRCEALLAVDVSETARRRPRTLCRPGEHSSRAGTTQSPNSMLRSKFGYMSGAAIGTRRIGSTSGGWRRRRIAACTSAIAAGNLMKLI
jgi:hypothetical protein